MSTWLGNIFVIFLNFFRENFKEKVRLMNTNHIAKHTALESWIAEKEAYLQTKENINSISEAQTQLRFECR
jgi:hypothetical protein